MKNIIKMVGGFLVAGWLGVAGIEAAIPTAGSNDPVVPGQWHSNLAAATAYAKANNIPMFVVWGNPGCAFCKGFDRILLDSTVAEYFSDSGLVLVYEHSQPNSGTPIRSWVGRGSYPLTRLTWWVNNKSVVDQKWQQPNSGAKDNVPKVLERIENFFATWIGDFSASPMDTSKDQYDPDNDTAAGAAVLTWSDQEQTIAGLKLAKTDENAEEPYSDMEDWYKLDTVAGGFYKVWFSGVSGIAGDAPFVELLGNIEGTEVVGTAPLSDGAYFEGESENDGVLYIRVARTSDNDNEILYTMHTQRIAPGIIEFVTPAVSEREDARNVVLQVQRSGGTSGEASVTVSTLDSSDFGSGHTATAGEDFVATPVPATLTWADGESGIKSVTITLIKNVKEWEGSETFGVVLTPTTENEVGESAVVTLLEVDPMVTEAASYTGFVGANEDGVGMLSLLSPSIRGTFSMSVAANGRITGKAVFPRQGQLLAGSYTLRNAQYQSIDIESGTAFITAQLVKSREVLDVEFILDIESGMMEGEIYGASQPLFVAMLRDSVAVDADLAASLVGSYTVILPVKDTLVPSDETAAPQGCGYLSIKVDKRGRFRAAGKLPDGTSYSQSGLLLTELHNNGGVDGLPTAVAVLFSAPTAYQGGHLSGMLRFADSNTNGIWDVTAIDDYNLECVSLKPIATAVYDLQTPGFVLHLDANGGRYDPKASLPELVADASLVVAELSEPARLPFKFSLTFVDPETGRNVTLRSDELASAISWQAMQPLELALAANGKSFVLPKGDLKKTGTGEDGQPLYNYDTGINPNNMQIRFTASSGLVRPSFRVYYDYPTTVNLARDPVRVSWKHTAKTISGAGVMIQEQADASTVFMAGYLLNTVKINYPESTRTYNYKDSSPFAILKVFK